MLQEIDFKNKKRVVIKIGSNSLLHKNTGKVDYLRIEKLIREIVDLKNRGLDVCLVSSGAIAVGKDSFNDSFECDSNAKKQALASIGQARLVSIYQNIFREYNQEAGQVLMTKNTILDNESRKNAQNTFEALFDMDIVPIVNENDTISTYEIQFGDNDTLSALVSYLINADLLILLSDIDGLYTANPRTHEDAEFVPYVDDIDKVFDMGSSHAGSNVGTGGMSTKLVAGKIATLSGADMIIANSKDLSIIHEIFEGDFKGTVFKSCYDDYFDVLGYIEDNYNY
ncbi:MAG: glutamate 5-kinase [Lachnospiraceae bacterium]|nr:glutamate 5-kinase [Lachnospiraceae bacterium]